MADLRTILLSGDVTEVQLIALLVKQEIEALQSGKSDVGHLHSEYAALIHAHLVSDITDFPLTMPSDPHTHAIADVTDLQTELDGKALAVHTHLKADITDFAHTLDSHSNIVITAATDGQLLAFDFASGNWINVDPAAGGGSVDSVNTKTGVVVVDLPDFPLVQAELDLKSAIGHLHVIDDVTGLQAALDGKAFTVHTHTIAEIELLQTTLDGKSDVGHVHAAAVITYDNTTSGLTAVQVQAAIDEMSSMLGTDGVVEYSATAADVGDIVASVNAMDWTGHAHASGTALDIQPNHIITFAVAGVNVAYRWVGLKPALVGLGGTYTVVADDFVTTGIGDHALLIGLDADDHPQYHNDARGDLRYSLLAHDHAGVYAPVIHTHLVADITDFPATMPPSAHTHLVAEITDFLPSDYALVGHAHTEYAAVSHIHAVADVTGLQAELDGKAPVLHGHAIGDVTDLQATLDGKSPLTIVYATEAEALTGSTGDTSARIHIAPVGS